jgi:Flp pilus assembly protein TadD
MKKLALIISISFILILTSCSAIPGMATKKPATTKKAPATTPTLIERISALETQELSMEMQLSKMQTTLDNLVPPDQQTAGTLQDQLFTMQKQIDDQLAQIKALQAK